MKDDIKIKKNVLRILNFSVWGIGTQFAVIDFLFTFFSVSILRIKKKYDFDASKVDTILFQVGRLIVC